MKNGQVDRDYKNYYIDIFEKILRDLKHAPPKNQKFIFLSNFIFALSMQHQDFRVHQKIVVFVVVFFYLPFNVYWTLVVEVVKYLIA